MATNFLLSAGYQYIGMDHFALPDDELAIAQKQGRLHRNFQGYTTHGDSDLIGLGPSAISKIGACYSQNTRSLRDYIDTLKQGALPTARGVELTRDDLLRRAVISAIMCQNLVDKRAIEITYLINFDEYFSRELTELEELKNQGWVILSNNEISVTADGVSSALRQVAVVFDLYAQRRKDRQNALRVS